MPKWWDTSKGAWGLLTIGVGVGVVLSLVSPQVGIPVGVIITLAGIVLVIRAHREKAKEKSEVNTKADKENLTATLKELKNTGRLDDISPVETDWIIARNIEMQWYHGHDDFLELLADRASGVPLNELMTRPCSRCGIPRNQKGKKIG